MSTTAVPRPSGLLRKSLGPMTAQLFRKLPLLFVLVVLVLIGEALSQGVFLRTSNIVTVLYQYSVTGLLALGELFVILTGGIDLSVGALVILSAVFAGDFSHAQSLPVVLPHLSSGLAVVLALLAGVVVGATNGLVVAYTKIPSVHRHPGDNAPMSGFGSLADRR